jgi:hypothetical protein
MKRVGLALLGAAILATASVPGVMAARRAEPKVVLIVGPVGGVTGEYRALAEDAAAVAEKYTRNVVRIYSPNATWPAVKQALDGASIVVYLGHGNGWPSPYRDSLYPASQNGLGLNPVAGVDDLSHQYFGEGPLVESGVRLAPNAVVLLHHLCYASGNTEPGLSEGTLAEAEARVDNYAAGFLRMGARAVVAEAHMGPAWYVRQILSSKRTIERIWKSSPTFHGNLLRFESARSQGFVAHMDPEFGDSGFYRSLVVRGGLRSDQVRGGAVASLQPLPVDVTGLGPSLAGTGIGFTAPTLRDPPTAATKTVLQLPVSLPDDEELPAKLMLGVRWDPLDVPPVAANVPPSQEASGGTDLVQPEVAGAVVDAVKAKKVKGGVAVPIAVPRDPGLYRLVTTIHDGEGVAYDAATQDLLPALVVRVTGPLAARYEAPVSVIAAPDAPLAIGVSIRNVGTASWGVPSAVDPRRAGGRLELIGTNVLVARWIGLSGEPVSTSETVAPLSQNVATGDTERVTLDVTTPAALGDYLVLLDVVTPEHGSLAAAGVAPAIVRVSIVDAADVPAPSPERDPGG